ncbi:MAG: hypothetical protein JEZ06_15065 [Anaerolineaceae bacterium]|nr:hypothetical protein [Anaerolineaceae bacterium]
MVWSYPSLKVGPIYGVSDRSIGKWCKKFEITKPPPGYWGKSFAEKKQIFLKANPGEESFWYEVHGEEIDLVD